MPNRTVFLPVAIGLAVLAGCRTAPIARFQIDPPSEKQAERDVSRLLRDGQDRQGVLALFYSNQAFKGRPVVALQPSVRLEGGDDPPYAGVTPDYTSRWIARLWVPRAGWWEIAAFADDGLRVWIDGRPVLDYWANGRDWRYGWPVEIAQGYHDILVEHFDQGGPSGLQLLWRDQPGGKFVEIPADHYHVHEGLREAVERLEALRAGGEGAAHRTAAHALGVD